MAKSTKRGECNRRTQEVTINFPVDSEENINCSELWNRIKSDKETWGSNEEIRYQSIVENLKWRDSFGYAVVELVSFVSNVYDKYKKDKVPKESLVNVLLDPRIERTRQDRHSVKLGEDKIFEITAGRSLKDDEGFKRSVRKLFVETINQRGIEDDMSITVKKWANERKLEIDSKEIAEAIISVNENGGITESVKEQLLVKILARKNQEDINVIRREKWEIESGDTTYVSNIKSEDLQNKIDRSLANRLILGLFFASIFWQKLQNIFGECCISKLEKVAKPRLAAVLPAA